MRLSNIIFCLATAVVVTAESDREERGVCRNAIWRAECPGSECLEWTEKVGDQCDDPGRRFLRGRGLAFTKYLPDTVSPTKEPTVSPSFSPTKEPTVSPSVSPTKYPTAAPTAPTVAPTKGVADCIGLDKINWDVLKTSGLVGTGGWKVSDLGRTIRFEVEPDELCGGTNPNTQTGEAKATITGLPPGVQLAYTLQGQGEIEASGFDELRFLIDGDIVASSTSPGGGGGCAAGDGPVLVTTTQASPVAVSGDIQLELEFTTIDNLYHKDSFYELTFNFVCP